MQYKLAKGTIWLIGAQIIALLSGYGIHAGIARYLGPETYGLFGIVISVLVWVETPLCGGIPTAVSKFISQNSRLALAIKNESMKLQITLAGLLFLIFFFIAPLMANLLQDERLVFYFRLAAIDIPLMAGYTLFLCVVNGFRDFVAQSIAAIIYAVSKLLTTYLLVFGGLSLTGALIGNVAASVFGLIAARSFCKFENYIGKFDGSEIIKFAIPMGLFELTYNLLMCLDLLLVKALISDGIQVGYYMAAVTLGKMPYFVFGVLIMSIFPSLSKSISEGNWELTITYINQAFRFILIVLLPITLLVIATSKELISLIYSEKYLPAASVLDILIIAFTFLMFIIVCATIIQSDNRPKLAFGIVAFLIPINIIANLKLIPLYGLKGAAIAATLTDFIGMIIMASLIFARFHTLISLKSFFKISAAAFITYFLAITYSTSGAWLIVNYIILFLIYFVLLVLLKEITLEDWMRIRSVFLRS